MVTPKGMRVQRFVAPSGDEIYIYSNAEKIIFQIRRSIPTEEDPAATSFKVGVILTENEALAIAGELLTASNLIRKAQEIKQGKHDL